MQALFYSKAGFGPFFLLLLLVCLAFMLPESMQHILAYQKANVASGEAWRLISGHLLHSNFYHLLLNGGGLLVIMLLHAG